VGGAGAGEREVDKDECRYCGKKGHWARDFRKKKREEAHLVQQQGNGEEGGALLMAQVCVFTETCHTSTDSPVHQTEERAQVNLGCADGNGDHAGVWYLDTRASNHMTGDRSVFAELDASVGGTINFGYGSVVDIRGRGTVVFSGKNNEQCAISDVYYIP
jgi:hypothetical protein